MTGNEEGRAIQMALTTGSHRAFSMRISAGSTAGLIGGFFFLLFSMLYFGLLSDEGMFAFPNRVATLFGIVQSQSFGGHTLFGIVLHFVMATFWGGVFGIIMPFTPTLQMGLVLGLILGLLLYTLMYFWLLPVLHLPFAQWGQTAPIILCHLCYGAAFALYPRLLD
jgi:hypothetical protein